MGLPCCHGSRPALRWCRSAGSRSGACPKEAPDDQGLVRDDAQAATSTAKPSLHAFALPLAVRSTMFLSSCSALPERTANRVRPMAVPIGSVTERSWTLKRTMRSVTVVTAWARPAGRTSTPGGPRRRRPRCARARVRSRRARRGSALLVLQAVAVLGLLVGGDAAVAERLLGNGRMCVGFGLAPGLEARHAPGAA